MWNYLIETRCKKCGAECNYVEYYDEFDGYWECPNCGLIVDEVKELDRIEVTFLASVGRICSPKD